MKYIGKTKHIVALATGMFIVFGASAKALEEDKKKKKEWTAEPLTESAMQVVSLEVGDNILNILGAPAAGLRTDDEEIYEIGDDLETNSHQESEEVAPVAKTVLKDLEDEAAELQPITNGADLGIDNDTIKHTIEATEKLNRFAKAYSTSSDITYKPQGHHHEMTPQQKGVVIERDLRIELLKLENLQGARPDDGRSAGNLYLSDWSSRGRSEIIQR